MGVSNKGSRPSGVRLTLSEEEFLLIIAAIKSQIKIIERVWVYMDGWDSALSWTEVLAFCNRFRALLKKIDTTEKSPNTHYRSFSLTADDLSLVYSLACQHRELCKLLYTDVNSEEKGFGRMLNNLVDKLSNCRSQLRWN